MPESSLYQRLLDQSQDLIWVINSDFTFVYANERYYSFIEKITGKEFTLNQSAFLAYFGEDSVEKWRAFYARALNGESFEVEDQYLSSESGETGYRLTTFEPLRNEENQVFAVSCQSKDITSVVKQKSEASQMMDASLDVFCTIDQQGNFVNVSAAAFNHWGYLPQELIGKPYMEFVLEEDVPKTISIAAFVQTGQDVNSFVNRYKKKDGEIAYNLWSTRWDSDTKLMYAVARDGKEKIEQEEKIQQSEQRFKALVQDGFDLISITDLDGNYRYISPTSTVITGFTPEEFMGKNVLDFIHPEDAERVFAEVAKLATQSKIELGPFRTKNKNNEWRWAQTVLTNMIDNPSVKGIVGNTRDITEAVNDLKQNEANEIFNRTILESSPDCLKILDTEGRIQYMNYNGLCQMEIDDFAKVKNKHWGTVWGSENEGFVKHALDRALLGETAQFTAYCATAKGTPKWWDVLVSPVGKPGEQIKQIISVSRDITNQKVEEQQLKLLGSVITNTHDAIIITEAEPFDEPGNRIIYVNEAFTKMTGYTAEEVIGKTPRMLQGANSNKEDLAALGRKMRNWEPCELTTINYKKSGEEFWVHFSLTPVADEKGYHTHWVSVEQDVTEQKNKELETELLASVSTSFNTENDYISAANEVCKAISKYGNFDLVEVWTANAERTFMQIFSHYVENPEDEKFYSLTDGPYTFSMTESMVGKVWAMQEQLLWDDVENNKSFVRRKAAKKIGLKAVLSIPLIFNKVAVGVLEIGTKHEAAYLKKFTLLFDKLQGFIGSELNRKKLESDLSQLYNSIPDIIGVGDFNGRILKINKAASKLLGYSEAELLHHSFEDFVHPGDIDVIGNEFKNLEEGRSDLHFEIRLLTKSGETIWLSSQCNLSVEEGVIYFTSKNITEEKKLKELNRQTRQLAKIGSWDLDLVNESLYWSEEVHQLHETDPNTYVPDFANAINFYREDFRQLVTQHTEKSIATGEPFDFEAVIITSNRKEIWVRSIGNAAFTDGKSTRIFGSFQDINSVKETENRLLSLSENLPGVFYHYIIHPDGTDAVQSISGAVEQLWGYTVDQIKANTNLLWDQVKLGGDMEEVKASLTKSIETKSRWTSRFKYLRPNGEMKTHLGIGGIPIFLADGRIIMNIILLDVTQEVKNDALLEEVTKLANIGSWEVELPQHNTNWSKMMYQILETDASQYIPDLESIINFYREDFRSIAQASIKECLANRTPVDFEAVVITANKNEKWVRLLGNVEMIDGKPARLFGSMQDITDRKKTEILLKESENKFRLLIENSADMLTLMNEAGKIVYTSPSVERMIGYTYEETMRLELKEIMHPDDFSMAMETLEEVFKNPSVPIPSTVRNRKKDGTYIWVEGTLTNMLHVPGVNAVVANVRDVTERIKSEEERNILHTTLENSLNEIQIYDSETLQFIYANKGALLNLGYTAQEIKKLSALELKPEFTEASFKKLISPLVNNEKEKLIFFTNYKRKDGTLYPVEIHLQQIKERNDNSLLAIILDITERKKAEEEKNSLQITLENSLNEIYIFDDQTFKFSYVNKGALQNLGYSETEIIALTPLDIKPDFTLASFKNLCLPLVNNEKSKIVFYTNHKRKDESLYPAEVHLQLVSVGNKKRFVAIILDITERKDAENEIRFKANLLSTIGQAAIATDLNGIVNYWNKAAETIYGWSLKEAIGQNIVQLTIPKPSKEQGSQIMETLKKGQTWSGNFKVQKKDGSEFMAMVSNSPVYDGNNVLSGIIGVSTDISRQVQNEELLRKYTQQLESSNERFEKVTEATNDLIWDWDIVNDVYYRSSALERFFGKKALQLFTTKDFWTDRFYPEDLPLIKNSINEALADPSINKWEMEYRLIAENGKTIYVIDRGIIVRNDEGNPIRMVGAMTDISDQKQMTVKLNELNQALQKHTIELERSNEDLEQFAFVASHDLQEPLRMISSFMNQLERKYKTQLDEKAQEYIYFATDGAKRMKQIILDLLQYSRTGRPTDGKEEVNFNEIIADFIQLRRQVISEKMASITFENLPTLHTYKAAITQILHCLIDNALKYTNTAVQPVVAITAKENEQAWEFAVQDNGIGIDPQFHDKIFIIFQRLHNKEDYGGTGIGLSIAKRHVEFLGGQIWLNSVIGKGTTFYFSIPKDNLQ